MLGEQMGRGAQPFSAKSAAAQTLPEQAQLCDARGRAFEPGAPLPDYTNLLIEFPEALSAEAQERARHIVCYWAKLAFVSGGSDENKWLSGRHFWIDASSLTSASSNWRKHEPFTLLDEFLREGTPLRKNGTRVAEGVGFMPTRVLLSHPGQRIPVERPASVSVPALRSSRQLMSFGR